MFNYSLFQISNIGKCLYAFRSFGEFAKENFNINDYTNVYNGNYKDIGIDENEDFNKDEALEYIFAKFNYENHGFRSLSVSDVVMIDYDNVKRYYYCDSFGWKEVTSFIENKGR